MTCSNRSSSELPKIQPFPNLFAFRLSDVDFCHLLSLRLNSGGSNRYPRYLCVGQAEGRCQAGDSPPGGDGDAEFSRVFSSFLKLASRIEMCHMRHLFSQVTSWGFTFWAFLALSASPGWKWKQYVDFGHAMAPM